MIRRAFLLSILFLFSAVVPATALELGPISLGVHLTPSVERTEARRAWDAVFSLSGAVLLDDATSLEVLIITDSGLTGLGTGVTYRRDLSDPFTVGAGASILWRVEERLLHPIIGTFALAGMGDELRSGFTGKLELSFPLLTLARQFSGWEILPLAELPTIILHGDLDLGNQGGVEGRITLQPVIVDTEQLTNPVGMVADNLLVLPTLSAFVRYLPVNSE